MEKLNVKGNISAINFILRLPILLQIMKSTLNLMTEVNVQKTFLKYSNTFLKFIKNLLLFQIFLRIAILMKMQLQLLGLFKMSFLKRRKQKSKYLKVFRSNSWPWNKVLDVRLIWIWWYVEDRVFEHDHIFSSKTSFKSLQKTFLSWILDNYKLFCYCSFKKCRFVVNN